MNTKRTKLWAGITAATLVGVTGLAGCSPEEKSGESGLSANAVAEAHHDSVPHHGGEGEAQHEHTLKSHHGGEGEGEGEGGEGGEGEGAKSVNLAVDDIAYLTQLSLMRGHLFVGYELYKAGHAEQANTHMKHPESELYADIAPVFAARGARGFAEELSGLAMAVEKDLGREAVDLAYTALTSAITKSEMAVAETAKSPKDNLKVVAQLLRVAGEEYGIAVVDGKMENAHEYQDALGFTTIAKAIIDSIDGAPDVQNQAKEILAGLKPLWPSLVPPVMLSTEAGQLYGAAARIELLALSF